MELLWRKNMSTVIRPELAKDNKYYISKHHFYELKHFCLQYGEWKERYESLLDTRKSLEIGERVDTSNSRNIVENIAAELSELSYRMKLVEDLTRVADTEIGDYIFKAVTEDLSFAYLQGKLGIPCGKDMYYDRYRRFFWMLGSER